MKSIFTVAYYGWLVISACVAVYFLFYDFAPVWLGVLMASLPPLVNRWGQFDDGSSPSAKAKYPRLSLFELSAIAWVILTLSEFGQPLWLALGCLGGFLLHSYWVEGGSPD